MKLIAVILVMIPPQWVILVLLHFVHLIRHAIVLSHLIRGFATPQRLHQLIPIHLLLHQVQPSNNQRLVVAPVIAQGVTQTLIIQTPKQEGTPENMLIVAASTAAMMALLMMNTIVGIDLRVYALLIKVMHVTMMLHVILDFCNTCVIIINLLM
jgi:hypothetical protein